MKNPRSYRQVLMMEVEISYLETGLCYSGVGSRNYIQSALENHLQILIVNIQKAIFICHPINSDL